MGTHQLIIREEKQGFPSEVYYRLSDKGKSLGPVLASLELWANEHAADEVNLLKQGKWVTADF